MAQERKQILFPVGRLVGGSLYKPREKDAEGQLLVIKKGANVGQSRVDYYLGVAFAKTAGVAWHQTEWGAAMLAAGAAAFPQQYQNADFAWKVDDGDSTVKNRKGLGRAPSENADWRGHWVVKFSGGFSPKVYQRLAAGGYSDVLPEGFVNLGDFIQIDGNVVGNGSTSQPGVFVNHGMTLFAAYGTRITLGPDAATVFGAGPAAALPAGASLTPVGVSAMPALAVAPEPLFRRVRIDDLAVAPASAPALAVAPNAAFLQGPAAGVAPPAALVAPMQVPPPVPVPALPPPAAVRRMTALAQTTYEEYVKAGWSDAQMISNGLLLA